MPRIVWNRRMTVGSFVASVPVVGETVSLIPADGHEQYCSEENIRNPCGIHQRVDVSRRKRKDLLFRWLAFVNG
jgi:hypothetical protein